MFCTVVCKFIIFCKYGIFQFHPLGGSWQHVLACGLHPFDITFANTSSVHVLIESLNSFCSGSSLAFSRMNRGIPFHFKYKFMTLSLKSLLLSSSFQSSIYHTNFFPTYQIPYEETRMILRWMLSIHDIPYFWDVQILFFKRTDFHYTRCVPYCKESDFYWLYGILPFFLVLKDI